MRIAQRMVSRNYMKTLNTSLSNRAESLKRGSDGLAFFKLSDNVADGSRAMHIQEERYQSTQQLANVEDLMSELNSVDSSMASIHSVLQSVQEKTLMALSDNYGDDKREVLAKEIGKLKEQLYQFSNAKFAGKYLFSGTNNSSQPFTTTDDGKLAFNGVKAEDIFKGDDGKYYYLTDPNDPNSKQEVKNSGNVYADIGLGLKISSDMQADPRTAFQVSFSGLELLGFGAPVEGENGTEVPTNAYDLLTELEEAIKPPFDRSKTEDLQRQLIKTTDRVGMARTDMGTRYNFLEKIQTQLEADIDNMSETESRLISSDPAEEAIKMKNCEYVWMAVLQLGSKVLPSSLLDYLR